MCFYFKISFKQFHFFQACEHHLSMPSEATSHYKMTCKSLFTEFIELQKLVSIIQTSKEVYLASPLIYYAFYLHKLI